VRKGGLEPPCPYGRSHLKAVRLPISPLPLAVNYSLEPTSSNSCLKLVCLPSPPPPQDSGSNYFFGVAGAAGFGTAGAEVRVGCRSRTVPAPAPAFRVARIESEIEVSINTTVEIVVAFDSSVAEPRGPNAVCEPMPPNAPARSAALPLCSKITIIRKRHTTTCTIVKRTEITT
jgi:hypothetical protein